MNKKKIILLGPCPPPYGGVAIYVKTLFTLLQSRGLKLWTYGARAPAAPGVHFMKDKRRELVPLLVKEGRRARIADCTHFLIEFPGLLVPLWVGLKLLLRFDWIKLIHDGSLPSRYERFSPLRRWLFRLAATSVTEFVVVSEDLQRWLRDEVKVGQRITHIKSLLPLPCCADDARLPDELEKTPAHDPPCERKVCSVGVFTPDYGFKHVADAVEQIRRETGERIGLILIDGAFVADERYRAEVLRDRDWITMLQHVPRADVLRMLTASDVFVRAFRYESYGLSRVEALWCGVPVVATRCGETRGMLTYDYGDEQELKRQIERALFHPSRREIQTWAMRYRREAEENLQAITRVLELNEG